MIWAKENLHLYRLLARMHHQFSPHEHDLGTIAKTLATAEHWETGSLAEPHETFKRQFGEIKEICQEQQFRLLVMTIPSIFEVRQRRGEEEGTQGGLNHSLPTIKALQVLSELGIEHFDAGEALITKPTRETHFRFDSHLSKLGNKLVADLLLQKLDRAEVP